MIIHLAATRLFSLPGLGLPHLPPEGGLRIARYLLDEQRVLMERRGIFKVVDIVSGEARTLNRTVGELVRYRSDGFELLMVPPYWVFGASARDQGPLWSVPYDGAPRLLAAQATRYGYTFKDGFGGAGVVDIDGEWRGTLIWTEPGSDAVLRIDEGVYASEVHVSSEVFEDVVVSYSISKGECWGVDCPDAGAVMRRQWWCIRGPGASALECGWPGCRRAEVASARGRACGRSQRGLFCGSEAEDVRRAGRVRGARLRRRAGVCRVRRGLRAGRAGSAARARAGERLNGKPFMIGERVVYAVGRGAPDQTRQPSPSTIGKTLWTTGPCGEAPVKVSGDIETALSITVWPGCCWPVMRPRARCWRSIRPGAVPANAVFTGVLAATCSGPRWA